MAREESRAIFFMKVKATDSALKLIEELKAQHGEELLFHQSGGCCDGSAPMCFQEGEFPLGDNDVKLGEIGGVPFYINGDSITILVYHHRKISNKNQTITLNRQQ